MEGTSEPSNSPSNRFGEGATETYGSNNEYIPAAPSPSVDEISKAVSKLEITADATADSWDTIDVSHTTSLLAASTGTVAAPYKAIPPTAGASLSTLCAPTSRKGGTILEPDPRPHLNVVFIGHVDAGKSTTCGNLLYVTGFVDERTIEKYEREAKEKNRESWFLAFIMDTNEEERTKGKTVEVGRAHFETPSRRFTILDAPGHKSFVPNMISGAAQADVGVLIISARKGEFETGFEKGGQTREHALLAKTLGVNQLIVVVNKMDDPTCAWDEARYREIEAKLTPFLKGCGYNPLKDLVFIPISGLQGQNLREHVSDPSFKGYSKEASWYGLDRPTLLQVFDKIESSERSSGAHLRIPLLDGYKDSGVMVVGKVESGTINPGVTCLLMPQKEKIKVLSVFLEDDEVSHALPGENVRLKIVGVEEEQISRGCVLCNVDNPCPIVTEFIGRVAIVEFLEHRPLLSAGYSCILHAHTAVEEVQFVKLLECIDKKTKKKSTNPQFVKSISIVTAHLQLNSPICLEVFDNFAQLGRFTLRDEGRTIAIGKVTSIVSSL
ncbi:putative elongation factor Tu [Cardiosporidium cionae]|uniref:Elongation factor Tu n=1 Tax=Cardiosporidium cionae TaxID=476202 RepID=A0ABQ7JBZ2_9APIC|nr:putative elongation factor Tu [Cardiosporidium cionae]|eukprot:KAF8821414.1 putative elongation factor Tu [Cardiosporidium cionae]